MKGTKSAIDPRHGSTRLPPVAARPTTRHLFAALALFIACNGSEPAPAPGDFPARGDDARPPNIVLFIVDTLRADVLGPYGAKAGQTPAIDAFASESMVFENAFAQSSWTRASVASILTSQYPKAHGAQDRGDRLGRQADLLSELLAQNGYHTGLVTTNPNVGTFFGFDQGFDDVIELFAPKTVDEVNPRELIATADDVAVRVNGWLDEAPEPFFLVVLSIDPHSPYSPPPAFAPDRADYDGAADGTGPWINRQDLGAEDKEHIRALYRAEVSYADHGFGRVREHMRATGRDAGTITVLTSDHGEAFWERGIRGHGKDLSEETLRVPLLIRAPERTSGGGRDARIVETVDIFPTLLDLVSIPAPDGISGRALLSEADSKDEGADRRAFASLQLGGLHQASVRDGKWKLVWDLDSGRKQLFDVSSGQEANAQSDLRGAALAKVLGQHLVENERKRLDRFGNGAAEPLRIEEIPDTERALLIELGYIDDAE